MRVPEHVGFADYAGRDGDGVYSCVKLCVRGCHKHLLEAAAACAEKGLHIRLVRGRGREGGEGGAGRCHFVVGGGVVL